MNLHDFDRLTPQARVEAFDLEHGLNAVVIDNWLFFADAARREVNPMGPLCEPPSDAYARAQLIAKYHDKKLALAVEEFASLKAELTTRTNATLRDKNCGSVPVGDADIERLKQLKKKVAQLKTASVKAQKALLDARPQSMLERERRNEQNRLQNQDVLIELNRIEI